MAVRPVFRTRKIAPYFQLCDTEFVYNGGFAVSQKQKNILALHASYNRSFPDSRVLEISSKSLQALGVSLSAFNLMKYVPSLGKSIPVENVFQGGKVFSGGGPYTDLYEGTPRAAKKDERLKTSGALTSFYFEEKNYPLMPKTAFYDWIYINALLENKELAAALSEYDAFTDIEFNPAKSLNCQARAAAVFVSLLREGLIEKVKDFDSYLEIIKRKY